jgi:lipoprotein-releasing system ATP-binding protein
MTDQPAKKLVLDGVRKAYATDAGPNEVLRGVSLEVRPGETVAIVGVSGSGKSTLLNIIGSLDRATAGRVRLGELEVTALGGAGLADYRRQQVGFVFQDHHLLPQCTVLENVLLPTLPTAAALGRSEDKAEELLRRVGLGGRANDFPQHLSGGERQRVAIARALVNGPPLVLCDEPTGNLDRKTGEAVAELFVELAGQRQVMMLVVTHNLDLAARFSRRLELRDGLLLS